MTRIPPITSSENHFLICIHDVSPAFACETRTIIRGLAPLAGRSISLGIVPNWHGAWPLSSHPDFCGMVHDAAEERLLHGYSHQRQSGSGATTWLTGGSDEMNGLDPAQTHRTLERGQREFGDVFGQPARGFLAPGWQTGNVCPTNTNNAGLEHVLGFFALRSSTGQRVPLATWSWDCGRWGWLGHVGHATGQMLHLLNGRIPVLAIHPNDLKRGYWPRILRLTKDLIQRGYEPVTSAQLLEPKC